MVCLTLNLPLPPPWGLSTGRFDIIIPTDSKGLAAVVWTRIWHTANITPGRLAPAGDWRPMAGPSPDRRPSVRRRAHSQRQLTATHQIPSHARCSARIAPPQMLKRNATMVKLSTNLISLKQGPAFPITLMPLLEGGDFVGFP